MRAMSIGPDIGFFYRQIRISGNLFLRENSSAQKTIKKYERSNGQGYEEIRVEPTDIKQDCT
jgi:hypothetical protein